MAPHIRSYKHGRRVLDVRLKQKCVASAKSRLTRLHRTHETDVTDGVVFWSANRAFHAQVLEIARSQRLKSMLATLIDMPVITRSFFLYRPADLERSLHQHLDITYAIEQNDGELAQRAMQTHIRMAYLRFMARRSESPVRREKNTKLKQYALESAPRDRAMTPA